MDGENASVNGQGPPGSLQQVLRKNGDLILTGRGGYFADIELAGMRHVAILRSPHPSALIRGIDTSRAARCLNVRTILTGRDAADMIPAIPHFFDPALVGGKTHDFRCLAVDRVRYEGEPVAAVVADTQADARAALETIIVDYEELPFVLDADEALKVDAVKIFEDWDDNAMIRLPFVEGNAAAQIEAAPHVIRDEIRIQRYQTAPLETRGFAAAWGLDGRLTFYATAQNPHPLRSHLARTFGVDESSVRVVATRLGGAFGHKFHGTPEESLICLLAQMTGTPVSWVESREEAMLTGGREFTHRFEVGFDDNGKILGFRDQVIANIGGLGSTGGWGMAFVAGMTFPGPYRVKHYDVESIAVVTNKPPWNGARSYGKESAALALERMIDLIADELDLDPALVRYRNFVPPEEFPYWTASKHLDSGNYAGALRQVLELAGYDELREQQAEAKRSGRLVGVGIGFELTPEGGDFSGSLLRGFDTSTVRMDPTSRVTVLTGVTSPGSGNETGIAQLVAAELGISPDDVRVVQGDTDTCPYGYGNFSSRSLTVGGAAAVLAARDVRETLSMAARVLLEAPDAPLVFESRTVRATSAPDRAVTVSELAQTVFLRSKALPGVELMQLESTRTYSPANVHNVFDEQGRWSPYPSYPYSAHVAGIEIDPETGVVRVTSYAGVHDCGTIINPVMVEGQFLGAIVMGIGGALWEELSYDVHGHLDTETFKQYLMPRAIDLPHIKVGSQITPSPFALYGMKGSGESGVAGAIAAVTNAVNDAVKHLRVRIHEMPLSAPHVLAAILRGGV